MSSNFLLGFFLGGLTEKGLSELTKIFNNYGAKDPEQHKAFLIGLYPLVDINLETLTDESKTKFDNPFTTVLKGAIEASAKKYNIILPNLDEGQPGD